jgi:hypothetical protein
MDRDTRGQQQEPGLAEQAHAVLAAQVSGVYGRLRRFRERYGARETPSGRLWGAEVERYLATPASPGRPRPDNGRAHCISPSVRSLTPEGPSPGWC